MTYNLFDKVALLHDSEMPELRAGAEGFVVDVSGPDVLMVEFPDESAPGYTIDVLTLYARDVKLVKAADSHAEEPISAHHA